MNPRVGKKGRSFKGAGLYYLHDKGAMTSDRVAFTQTHNLPTDNAEMAFKIMAHTAMHQNEIKAASGQVSTGRKATTSVYPYALTWHPTDEPAPTKQEMIDAALTSLQVMGIQDHEAVFVAHNDTAHPHIHVIVNRVHPETGILNTHSCDQTRLSDWAYEYNKARGTEDLTPARTKNVNERRKRKKRGENAFVKHKQKDNVADFQKFKKAKQPAAAQDFNLDYGPPQPDSPRQGLYQDKENRIEHRKLQIKGRYRPQWSALYKHQRDELKLHAKNLDHALYRVKTALKHRDPKQRGILLTAGRAFFGKKDFIKTNLTKHIIDKQEAERKELSSTQYQAAKLIIEEENRAYYSRLDELREIEKPTYKRKKARQKTQDKTPPKVSEEFKKRARKRHRKRKKRDDRGKGHDRERD